MYRFKEKKSNTGRNIFLALIVVATVSGGALYYFKPEIFQNILEKKKQTIENNVRGVVGTSQVEKNFRYQNEYKGEVFATVTNREGENIQLSLDIYRPHNSDEKTPVVIYIPGKSWLLEKENLESNGLFKKIKELNERGITVAVPEYRDAIQGIFPSQIHDVKGAVRFLKGNSEKYGLLKDSFAAVGEDSGGALALLLGSTAGRNEFRGDVGDFKEQDADIKATATFGAVTDLMNVSQDMNTRLMSRADAEKRFDSHEAMEAALINFTDSPEQGMKLIRRLRRDRSTRSPHWEKVLLTEMVSPMYYINEGTVPALIIHGVDNVDVPLRQSLKFVENLMRTGVEHIYLSNSTGAAGYQSDEISNFANEWLEKKLK